MKKTSPNCRRTIREQLEFVLVDRIDDVLTAAMPELAERLNHVGV